MNLPNKITVARMAMVPFFVFFLLFTPQMPYFKWIAFFIFVVASLTDLIDGKIARKYNLVTNFGKFMDPLADKLLVCSAIIGLTSLGIIPAWMTIVIIGREFIISGFRLVAAEKGEVIAAGFWGKIKTVVQMVMICILLFIMNKQFFGFWNQGIEFLFYVLNMLGMITLWLSVILTIVSLVDYLVKNKNVMKEDVK